MSILYQPGSDLTMTPFLMILNDVLSILTCLDRLKDHSNQISAQ